MKNILWELTPLGTTDTIVQVENCKRVIKVLLSKQD